MRCSSIASASASSEQVALAGKCLKDLERNQIAEMQFSHVLAVSVCVFVSLCLCVFATKVPKMSRCPVAAVAHSFQAEQKNNFSWVLHRLKSTPRHRREQHLRHTRHTGGASFGLHQYHFEGFWGKMLALHRLLHDRKPLRWLFLLAQHMLKHAPRFSQYLTHLQVWLCQGYVRGLF